MPTMCVCAPFTVVLKSAEVFLFFNLFIYIPELRVCFYIKNSLPEAVLALLLHTAFHHEPC